MTKPLSEQETTAQSDQAELDRLASEIQESNDAAARAAEADAAPAEGQAEEADAAGDESELPEKFRGKSAAEIARSYSELEKHVGKISSERAHKDREAEELRMRLIAVEQQMRVTSTAKQQAEEQDPLASLEDEFAVEPRQAAKKLVDYVRNETRRSRTELENEFRGRSAHDHYQKMKTENPDFAELEPEMQQTARQIASFVKPEFLNSPEMIDYLYTHAKGRNIAKYTSEAAEKSKRAKDLVKAEKRAAFSESSQTQSQGASEKSFEEMTLEQMAAKLGRVPE